MANDQTIRRLIVDCTDGLEALVPRVVLAARDRQGANRQANRLGTTVSGGRGDGPQYSDPTADEAGRIMDLEERTITTLGDIKHTLYGILNGGYAEWAPDRHPDNGIRRCGMDDCAKPHKSRGLCDMHRQRLRRYEAARAAQEKAS